MTEAEWLTSADPAAMLGHLLYWDDGAMAKIGAAAPPGRKLRLFAEACCRAHGAGEDVKAALLRCLVGNPWRPARLDLPPSRELAHAESMALAIDDGELWGDLPILADALEEAGCPAEVECNCGLCVEMDDHRGCSCKGTGRVPHPLLAHLRGPGPHARG